MLKALALLVIGRKTLHISSVVALAIIFFILTLVQTSILVHFMIFGIVLNISLISVVLMNIFENPKSNLGLYAAVISGFFLDIFSMRPFGFWILILFLVALFIKLIFRKYVRIPLAS